MRTALPPSTTGQPPRWALMVKKSPKAEVMGDVSGNMACADTPPRSAFARAVRKRLTRCDADDTPERPKRAKATGWRGTLRRGAKIEGMVFSASATKGPINFSYAAP